MPENLPLPKLDAALMSELRAAMPTSMGTTELRELGAEILGRAVFTARGSNAIFATKLKELINRLAAGELGEGQVRTAIWEALEALGYDVERGGFPGEELEPGLKGTLQDLKSFRRRDLIVRTQLDLMQGAGQQERGMRPEYLAEFPAWELVRVKTVAVPRDWPSRWAIAGGRRASNIELPTSNVEGRMIALKGDPVWGELGSYDNFQDALGVDHPPFAFNSGMGWREVSAAEVARLGITGPAGETPDEWLASRPAVMGGKFPLPSPRLSLQGVDTDLIERFKKTTYAGAVPGKPYVMDYSDILAREIANRDAARAAKGGDQ